MAQQSMQDGRLIPVKFHSDKVFLVSKDGEPYVPVKPIVENLGIVWERQRQKLSHDHKRWGTTICRVPSKGGKQDMVCLPLRKLFAFLFSIDPRKVKPSIRQKLIDYQNECDSVLWNYWTKGQAIRPVSNNRLPVPPEKREVFDHTVEEIRKETAINLLSLQNKLNHSRNKDMEWVKRLIRYRNMGLYYWEISKILDCHEITLYKYKSLIKKSGLWDLLIPPSQTSAPAISKEVL